MCPKCGAEIESHFNFCPQCRVDLRPYQTVCDDCKTGFHLWMMSDAARENLNGCPHCAGTTFRFPAQA